MPLVLSNAARFTGPVDTGLLRALRPWRARTFGPFEVREVEIVRTNGFMSPDRTEIPALEPDPDMRIASAAEFRSRLDAIHRPASAKA